MMYKISESFIGPYSLITLKSPKNEIFTLFPGMGGAMNELELLKNGKLYAILSGAKNEEEIVEKTKTQYKGALLFPFVNRIDNGRYRYKGSDYTFPIVDKDNDNAIHGFAFFEKAKVVHEVTTPYSAQVALKLHSEGKIASYPFLFELIIFYTLTEGKLEVKTEVRNIGISTMPYTIGWHPYFNIDPIHTKLFINCDSYLENDERCLPTGKIIKDSRFEKQFTTYDNYLDHCFVLNGRDSKHIVSIIDAHPNVIIDLVAVKKDSGYNYIHVYTPQDRTILAIEPVTGEPNAFNTYRGLRELNPGEKDTQSFLLSIR
jgi:aldose 1-epimerase